MFRETKQKRKLKKQEMLHILTVGVREIRHQILMFSNNAFQKGLGLVISGNFLYYIFWKKNLCN